jgi:DNA modification methylase
MIPDKSIQCVITSPPYFGLRKYDGAQDVEWSEVSYCPMAGLPPLTVPAMTCPLGNEPTIEAYIGHLILCAREWRRCLADDGVCWVNLGDSFVGGGNNKPHTGGYGVRGEKGKRDKMFARKAKSAVPQKNLLLIPARFALAMQADGWILRSEIIWHKPNPMPESVTDRPTKAHEQIYLFSKQERYFYDADAVREPHTAKPKRSGKGWLDNTEGIVLGRKTKPNCGLRERTENPLGRNLRSVWTVSTRAFVSSHFAVFPPALIEPMIKAGSRVGDTVLDPFNGSGTTGRVAIKLGRKYCGVDLSEKYLDELAPERLTVQMEMVS